MQIFKAKIKIDKVLVFLVTVLILVVVLQFTFFRNNKFSLEGNKEQEKTRTQEQAAKTNINRVIIDFSDGRKIDQSLKAETPFKALQAIAGSQGYKIHFKEYKYGLIVDEINNVKNSTAKYWIYSVNGNPGKIAADRYMLAESDFVEWKYTSAK